MICIICKKKIIEKKERWVRLTDFNRGITTGEQCYHLECWGDRFRISNSKRKQEMYEQAFSAIQKIAGTINPELLNPNRKKVYKIST